MIVLAPHHAPLSSHRIPVIAATASLAVMTTSALVQTPNHAPPVATTSAATNLTLTTATIPARSIQTARR